MSPISWQMFAQGEYIGPPRLAHLPEYRLRVDDVLEFVYRLTGKADPRPYRFNIGDTLKIESLTAKELDREVLIQPDGTITLRQIGQVPAAGRTVEELRKDLDRRYQKLVLEPNMTVTPIELNTTLEELRSTVDRRAGAGGQSRQAKVDPEGTVQLPAIGSVPAHGLTLAELKREIEHRYSALVHGIEVTPILIQRAPRFVYVVGEVRNPGRFTLEGPTTSMQAIAMAGSWNVGAELEEVIIFRRDQNWRLMATKLNLRDAFYREDACPQDEIWLRDSDIVLVPKSTLLETDDFINLFFTRGIYGVVPFNTSVSFFKDLSTIGVLAP